MTIYLTLEDFEDAVPSGVVSAEPLDEDQSAEYAHLRLCESHRQLDDHSEALAQASDHLNAMSQMTEIMPLETGLSAPVFESLQAAIQGLVKTMGGRRDSVVMEQQADPAARSRIALETLSETVKRVWDRLIEAFQSAWQWFKNFIKSLFDTTLHLQRRAKKLEKALNSREDIDGKEVTPIVQLRTLRFVGDLGAGRSVQPQAVLRAYGDQNQAIVAIQRGAMGFMADAGKGLKSLLMEYNRLADEAPDVQAEKFQTFVRREVTPLFYSSSWYKAVQAQKVSGRAPETRENTDLYVREFALGGGRFYGRVVSPGIPKEKGGSAMRFVGFGVTRMADTKPATQLVPMNQAECRQALNLINNQLDEIRGLNQEARILDDALKELLKTGKTFGIRAGHEHLRTPMLNSISSTAVLMMRMSTSSNGSLSRYSIDCAKHMLDIVALSIKAMPEIQSAA